MPALALVFLIIGTQAFGGQATLLPLLERDLAVRRGWLSAAEITDAFTYVMLLPGSTNVQAVAYLGYRLRGLTGTVAATSAFLLPSFLVMLGFAVTYHVFVRVHGIAAALQGLTAATVGIIAVTMLTLGRRTLKGWSDAAVAVLVIVLAIEFHINVALLVALAGMVGVVREALRSRKTRQ